MGRHPRIEVAGGLFHVTARGNNRQHIFLDDYDYVAFLLRLESAVAEHGWRCHSYCVLPSHYHLYLETPEPTLAAGMRRLNGSYALRFNLRYGRVGHVFQSPYRSRLVQEEQHFLEVWRYIALNPVRAGLCRRPETWPWSSYLPLTGKRESPPFLATGRLEDAFEGGSVGFRRFVLEGLPHATAAVEAEDDPLAAAAMSLDPVPRQGSLGNDRRNHDPGPGPE